MAITVEAVHRKVQYTSTGSAGPYSFAFKVLAATDIKVSVGSTVKTVSTHYTTAYAADGTGSVTFTSGNEPASDAVVTIESDQAIARTTDYTTGGDFTAASINDALDRLTINDQQIETELSRNIQLASTTTRATSGSGTSGPLTWPYDATASNNASKVIAYDSDGTALELGPTTTQITSASTNATAAASSATAAASSATAAASSATTAASDVASVAFKYTWSNSTSMADPGTGALRYNHATTSSVSAIAIDDTTADSGNPDINAFIATWDDSTSTVKGQLQIVKSGTPATFAIFNITGLTDNSGWAQIAVSHVSSNGTISNSDAIRISFTRTGLKGDTGTTGSTGSTGATGAQGATGPVGVGLALALGG